MEKKLKRLLSFAVALALVISCMPGKLLHVAATPDGEVWSGGAINDSGSYYLTGDVDLSTTNAVITIGSQLKVTINLNGYNIIAAEGKGCFDIFGELTVKDTSTHQNGKIKGSGTVGVSTVFVQTGASFTLDSGIVTGGSIYADASSVVAISGGSLEGETYIQSAASCTVSGNPVIADLHLVSNTFINLGEMTQGAAITVRTDTPSGVITGALQDAGSYLPYFRAGKAGCGIGVKGRALAITQGCACGCGRADEAIAWEDFNTYLNTLGSNGTIVSNHYRLTGNLTLTDGQLTIPKDTRVTLDLNGHTIAPAAGARVFLVEGILDIMDTAGGGKIIGGELKSGQNNADIGGAIYIYSGALNLYSGTITGGKANYRGGNIYILDGSTFNMYGGAVTNGISANNFGGNIYATGSNSTTNIQGGTISGGTATNGANIALLYGTLNISGGNVEGNTGSNIYIYGQSANEKKPTVNISGGEIYGSAKNLLASSSYATIHISGGHIQGETCIQGAVTELKLSGKPVLENLNLVNTDITTLDILDAGASITVQSSDDVFSNVPSHVKENFSYFHAYAYGKVVDVVDNQFTLVTNCPHCGATHGSVTWTPWSGEAFSTDEHYKLTKNVDLTGCIGLNAKEVCLDLNGFVITGATDNEVFRVYGGATLTILDSSAEGSGSIQAAGQTSKDGGALYIGKESTFNLYGGTISGGASTTLGGNVFVGENGTFNMYGGTLTHGTAPRGGNLYLYSSTANLYGGTITRGTATGSSSSSDNRGGNLYLNSKATLHMYGGIISSGKATRGGNIATESKTYLSGGTISDGSATYGGNIYTQHSTSNVVISNTASITGGTSSNGKGVCLMYGAMTMTGGTISGDVYATGASGNHSTVEISGGTISGFSSIGTVASNEATDITISGGKFNGTTTISTCKSLVLTGTPNIARLTLGTGVVITPLRLTTGASISVYDAPGIFTTTQAERFQSYFQYIGSTGNEMVIVDDRLAIVSKTPTGTCGDNVTYQILDSGELIISGTGAIGDFGSDASPWFKKRANIKKVIVQEGITHIGTRAFDSCEYIEEVILADSVETIGEAAFIDCKKLQSIDLSKNLESIGVIAFYRCSSLKSMELPTGCLQIKALAFYGCTNMTSIVLPNTVNDISSNNPFSGFTANQHIYFRGTQAQWNALRVTTNATVHCDFADGSTDGGAVGWQLIGSSTLTIYGSGEMPSYYYNTSLTSYNGSPWSSYASQITTVVVESGVTSVGQWAFYGLTNLTSVTISDTVVKIGANAFRGCTSLGNIALPDSVQVIGENAFYGCTSLTGITGAGGITAIGARAFYDCTALTNFSIGANVSNIGQLAFGQCAASITVADGNTVYSSESGVLFNKQKDTLIQAPTTLSGSYTVPSTVTTIAAQAFDSCNALTAVVIPNNVITIEDAAFFGCQNLETVTLGAGVTTIGTQAFAGCNRITSFSVDNGNKKYAADDTGALCSKDKKTLIQVPGGKTGIYTVADTVDTLGENAMAHNTNLIGVTLPDTVDTVARWTFAGCTELESVTLPASVTTVSTGAFEGAGLTDVYYVGKVEQWENVTVERYNEPLATASIHYVVVDSGPCGDGLTWTLTDDGKLTISGTGAMWDYTAYTAPWYIHNAVITTVVLESGVTAIDTGAFSLCHGLIAFQAEQQSTSFTADAAGVLYNLDSTTLVLAPAALTGSYTVADTVTTIGADAFAGCAGLTDILFSKSVTAIEDNAFLGCSALHNVSYGGSRTEWRAISKGVGNEALTSAAISYGTLQCASIAIQTQPSKLSYYVGDSLDTSGLVLTVIYDDDSTVIVSEGYAVTPETVTEAGNTTVTITYEGKTTTYNITAVIGGICGQSQNWSLEEGVLTISGTGAMADYTAENAPWLPYAEDIITVNIAAGITAVDTDAFGICSALTAFQVEQQSTSFTADAAGVLYNQDSTTLVLAPAALAGSYTVANTVTTIGAGAFAGCAGLTAITIPASVTTVEENAFLGCTGLQTVDYGSTQADWQTITFGEGNQALSNATIHYTSHVMLGDVNGNGSIDNLDAILLLQYLCNSSVECDLSAADITGNGSVDNLDAIWLIRYLSNSSVKLGE